MFIVRLLATSATILFSLVTCCFAQDSPGPAAKVRRIVIQFPDNVDPSTVWIRYLINRRGSRGEFIQTENHAHEYVILSNEHQKEPAKIVLYRPGCKFTIFELDLSGGSDIERRFTCDPLPGKKLRGVIATAEIPRSIYSQREKRLDLLGHFDAPWICSYFLQPNGGSCLSSGVPLGMLGTLDPADGGNFEITIPDFSRDPAVQNPRFARPNSGDITIVLHDKKIGAQLGLIMPEGSPPERRGLAIQPEYSEPVLFTRVH